MELTKDFYKYTLYTVLSGAILLLICNGTADAYVHFPSVLNEMGTAFFAAMITGACMITAISEFVKSIKS